MQAFYVINASVAALGYDTKYSLFYSYSAALLSLAMSQKCDKTSTEDLKLWSFMLTALVLWW